MPIDLAVFTIGTIMIVLFMIPAFFLDGKWWIIGALFAFLGGIFGALFVVSIQDGLVTTAYAYSAGFQLSNASASALINAPIFLTLASFGVSLFRAVRHD